jgi:hypothetical protein
MRRVLGLVAAAGFGLAGALLAGCGANSGPAGEGRLTVRGPGTVVVQRVGGVRSVVRGSTTLHRGDDVNIPLTGGGTASVALPSGGSLELRAGSVVGFVNGPQLDAGDLLVVGPNHPVTVSSTNQSAVVNGIARLRRDLVFAVAVYQGNATVLSAARSLPVPAYRQASVAAVGLLPDHPSPLALNPLDPWDVRYLGEAIDLSDQLNSDSRGFTAAIPAHLAITAAFFRQALTQLPADPTFSDALLTVPATDGLPQGATAIGQRAPGELLVGASIVIEGKSKTFADRWPAVFGFRDQGAAWGLVALDQGADPRALLDLVGKAINRSGLVFTVAPPSTTPVTSLAALAPSTSTRTTVGTSPTTTERQAPRPPSTTTKPTLLATPPASPASPAVDPIVQLLNGLVGSLTPGH